MRININLPTDCATPSFFLGVRVMCMLLVLPEVLLSNSERVIVGGPPPADIEVHLDGECVFVTRSITLSLPNTDLSQPKFEVDDDLLYYEVFDQATSASLRLGPYVGPFHFVNDPKQVSREPVLYEFGPAAPTQTNRMAVAKSNLSAIVDGEVRTADEVARSWRRQTYPDRVRAAIDDLPGTLKALRNVESGFSAKDRELIEREFLHTTGEFVPTILSNSDRVAVLDRHRLMVAYPGANAPHCSVGVPPLEHFFATDHNSVVVGLGDRILVVDVHRIGKDTHWRVFELDGCELKLLHEELSYPYPGGLYVSDPIRN